MRMNYRKRLWPMLALLPVFALAAAALTIGLPGLSPPPPAEAQTLPTGANVLVATGEECGFTMTDDGGDASISFHGTLTQLVQGGPCVTQSDSIAVVITNEDTDGSIAGATVGNASVIVYVTGGDDFPNVQAGGTTTPLGAKGVDEVRLTIPSSGSDPFDTDLHGKATVNVSSSMAGKGDVYLFFYTGAHADTPLSRTAPPTVLPAGTGNAKILKVVFVGDPVLKTADGMTDRSTLKVSAVGDPTPDADTEAISTTTGQREVYVTSQGEATARLALEDENGNVVNAQATFTIGGPANIDFAGSNLKTSIKSGTATGIITETIRNLPATGALRIPLDVTVGDLEFPTYYIIRTGSTAAELSGVKAYACTVVLDATSGEPVTTQTPPDEEDNYCVDEAADLRDTNTANDPDELTVVAPGDHFLLVGNARDSVGNLSQADPFTLRWSAGDDTAAVLANTSTENVEFTERTGGTVDDLDTAVVRVSSTASLGSYSLTVADKGGDVPEDGRATVNFIVSGGPDPEDGYSISGADNIPLGRWERYTVRVLDANDNPPNLDDTNRCIGIRVRGVGFNSERDLISRVETSGPCDGLTRLDNAGQANFTIEAPLGITAGTEASIQIRAYGEIVADKTITFGEAPLVLGNPAGLAVTSDAAGMATVTWTPGENATAHFIWSVKPDNTGGKYTRAAGDAGMVTIDGLESGADYYFIGIAGRTENNMTRWSGWTNWSARTTID